MSSRRSLASSCLAAITLGVALVGCAASQPAEVAQAKHLRITYHDFRTDLSFVLGDKDDPEFENIYSKKQNTAGVKVTDSEHLQRVVAELADADYFEHAGNVESPEAIAGQDPYKFFCVLADGRPYSLYLAKGVAAGNKNIAISMSKAAEIVTRAFNEVPQLQWVDTKGAGERFYEEEQKRLEREASETRKGGKSGGK